MKELSIEDKARRYDEALKVLHKYDGANIMFSQSLKEEMFPELRENEDERIRLKLIEAIKGDMVIGGTKDKQLAIAYLEKQGEHANFRNKIQIGDKVTRNEDGVLVNLSQLERVAKKNKKQGEQKLYVNDNAKEMFIKALERVEEQNNKGYKLTDCDKNSWWEDFKNYTSCTIEQKPAWSEDDENMLNLIIARLYSNPNVELEEYGKLYGWLNSRLSQKLSNIERNGKNWKPTEEQMEALAEALSLANNCDEESAFDLRTLYKQLKKLREE